MKTSNVLSNLSPNNSILLIIFVFIFIAVGMFFLIQRTTEKKKKDEEDKRYRLIEERKEEANASSRENSNNGNGSNSVNIVADEYTTQHNTVSGTFDDEVGLFIKKDETRPEMYSHSPIYIPPFNTGKETRCVTRHINKPNSTMVVQSCSNSDLVKISSNASY
jgi:hypothetical protein